MLLVTGYAQTLRALGQAIETLNIGDFGIEPYDDGYRVTGDAALDRLVGMSDHGNRRPAEPVNFQPAAMELSFSFGDAARVDREGRERRPSVNADPGPSRLSQALRVLGSYLDQKYSRMVRLSRRGESFELIYESSLGSRYCEAFSPADLYNLWVRFYLRRAARLAPAWRF